MDSTTRSVAELYEKYPFPGSGVLLEALPAIYCLDEVLLGLGSQPALNGARVLDLGCGTAEATLSYARKFPQVQFVALDLSGEAIEIASEAAHKHGIGNISFLLADAMSPASLPPGPFDAAIARGSVHHFRNPIMGLRNIVHILRPSAVFAMALYNPHERNDWDRFRRALNILGADLDEDGIALARSLIDLFSDGPRSFLACPLFGLDTLVADSFLHPNLHEYTLDTIDPLLDGAGLVQRRILLNDWETPHYISGNPRSSYSLPVNFPEAAKRHLEALPRSKREQFMELLLRPSLFQVYAQRPPITEARCPADPSEYQPLRASFIRLEARLDGDTPTCFEIVVERKRVEVNERDWRFLEAATGEQTFLSIASDIYGTKQAREALAQINDWFHNGWIYLMEPDG